MVKINTCDSCFRGNSLISVWRSTGQKKIYKKQLKVGVITDYLAFPVEQQGSNKYEVIIEPLVIHPRANAWHEGCAGPLPILKSSVDSSSCFKTNHLLLLPVSFLSVFVRR